MKNWGRCVMFLLVGILISIPLFVNADSWKSRACNTANLDVVGCYGVSNKYTEPYCVTSLSNNDREASDVNYVKSCVWPPLVNNISSIKDMEKTIDRFTTRDVVELYCLSLYGQGDTGRIYFARPSGQKDSWDWQQTFDSHQSLFLHVLCSTFTEGGDTPFINDNDLVGEVFEGDLVEILKLQQMSNGKNNCSLDDDITIADCDMSIYAAKVYQGIMTDLYKIKYAQVLDVNTTKNFDSDYYKKVLNFMSGYYLLAKTETFYEYQKLKAEYPKTISILESNQRYHKNYLLDTIKIMNNTLLADKADASGCPVMGNMVGVDFVACALHSSQRDGFSLTPSFVTLLYNEILHYRQFVTFYQKWLELKIAAMGESKTLEKTIRIYQSKITDLKKYHDLQMNATEWAERGFEEFNMTYPLHIWILLLLEKGEKFRNFSLSPEITLFYSLSEKLQNVQIPISS